MHDRVEQIKVNLYEELLDKCCFVCQTAISDDFVGGSIHQGADRFSDVSRAMCFEFQLCCGKGRCAPVSEFGQCASQRGIRGVRAMTASHARHASRVGTKRRPKTEDPKTKTPSKSS